MIEIMELSSNNFILPFIVYSEYFVTAKKEKEKQLFHL